MAVSPALAESPRTIIVLDGSGSMWGQIDGRAKLEIARDTVAEVLGQIPADQELGLMAYGHRRKGDCSDIELMVPPAAGSGTDIAARVKAMRFLGKTPLSEAVRQAAEALRYREDAATVVLVTDGLETCEADPCALARELEQTGLNFTAHVIGFGLTRDEGAQVACLAENTGGRYLEARNATDLAGALVNAVTANPAPPPPAPETVATPLPDAGLTAPDSAPLGSMVEVGWTVTDTNAFDTITIGRPNEDGYIYYVYASQNPVSIQMPGETGSFELRYVSADKNIVHRRMIEVTEAPLSLDAPEQVVAGQLFPVHWQGPDAENDNIRLQRTAQEGYISYEYVSGSNPILLRAPEEAGRYEVVYMLNDAEPIITRAIEVLPQGSTAPPIPASLSAPDVTEAGEEFSVGWSGPGHKADAIWLRLPGDSSYISYAMITDGNPVTLWAPAEPGAYELVYKMGDEQDLNVRSLTVVAAGAVPDQGVTDQSTPVAPAAAPAAEAAATPVPISVTIEAEGAADLFSVQWSAVPTADNELARTYAPEAWAMAESTLGPVEAQLLEGGYDVVGYAGDQVFAGRIDVAAEGQTRFVIPLDPTLSPAGPDAAPSLSDPVTVKIKGEYFGMPIQWKATAASGQASEAVVTDFQLTAFEPMLTTGRWLIEGFAKTGEGHLYAAVIDVTGPAEITLTRTSAASDTPVMLPTDEIAEAHCVGEVACYHTDPAGALRYLLLPEWAASKALFYETAGGVVADLPSVEFYTGTPFAVMAALNPRQWDASLGPCNQTELGPLCAVNEADPAAVALLQTSIVHRPQDAPAAASETPAASLVDPDAKAAEVDVLLDLPEGLDPTEIFAPQLMKKD